MQKRWTVGLLFTSALVLAFLLGVFLEPTPDGVGVKVSNAQGAASTDLARTSPFGEVPWSQDTGTPEPAKSTGWWLGAGPPTNPADANPLSTMSPPSFTAGPRGHLVLNGDTHANIERLFLAGSQQAIQAQLQDVSRNLPETAARELKDLVTKFQKYSTALSQSIPPGNTVATEQEAFAQLDQLHNLRVSYLGEETAQLLFGEEEATSRYMLGLAQLEKDTTLTLQQKAERAQVLLSKLPVSSTRR